MTVDDVRLENARTLLKECGGHGGQTRMADKLGMSRQLLSNYIGQTPVKRIGRGVARAMERAFGRPVGWLDENHAGPGALADGVVTIGVIDGPGPLGSGRLPMLRDATVKQMSVSAEWIRRRVGSRPGDYLAIATVDTDALEPIVSDGDVVMIDRGESAASKDGIYLLGAANQRALTYRRISRRPDGTYLLSTKNKADSQQVGDLAKAGIVVLGRVIATLSLTRL